MNKFPNIAFDIDDVTVDTVGLFIEIAHQHQHAFNIRREDMTMFDLEKCLPLDPSITRKILENIQSGKYDFHLKLMPGAFKFLNKLARLFNSILFVTTRSHIQLIRSELCKLLSISTKQFEIVAAGSYEAKANVLASRGICWFVDDRLETCLSLKRSGITPILFKQPWNRGNHSFIEVSSWNEIESIYISKIAQQGSL